MLVEARGARLFDHGGWMLADARLAGLLLGDRVFPIHNSILAGSADFCSNALFCYSALCRVCFLLGWLRAP